MRLAKIALQLTFKTFRKVLFMKARMQGSLVNCGNHAVSVVLKITPSVFTMLRIQNTAVNKISPPLCKLQVLRSSRSFRSIKNVKSRS